MSRERSSGATTSEQKEAGKGAKLTGAIKRWNPEKGYGFLRLADGQELFCHTSELCEHLRPSRGEAPASGTKVTITKIVARDKGQAAKGVQCDECAIPEQWELRPFGPVIFGVQELRPVCINKPQVPSYHSTIPDQEVKKANEPFSKAQEKQRLWGYDLTSQFFKEFGEPQSVQAEGDDKILLTYPFGTKTVSAADAYRSKHWETYQSNKWRKGEGKIEIEFLFKEIPNARVWRMVVYSLEGYHLPRIGEEFEILTPETQKEIIAKVKESVLSPENFASKRWDVTVGKDGEKQKEIAELKQDIFDLQAPGELYITSRTRKTQKYEPPSPDERRGNYRYDTEVTDWSLVVGAKKREHPGWASDSQGGNYQGGKSFSIYSAETGRYGSADAGPKESAEQFRQSLLDKKRKKLKEIFERAKVVESTSIDPRIYDLTPEEWSTRYNQSWGALQQQVEQEWQTEEQQAPARLK